MEGHAPVEDTVKTVRVALLFVDGVGIGRRDPARNPLAREGFLLSQFSDGDGEPLPGGGRAIPLDTTFGVPGRPQSASNQTAILTGLPAPQLIGKHVLGYPNVELRAILERHSIVKALTQAGHGATFANSYPVPYLAALGLPHRPGDEPALTIPPAARRRLRPSATTLAMAAGGIVLRTLDDARRGHGLTHDIDGARGRAHGMDVPERSSDEAAEIFWRLSEGHAFTLFEHYQADEAGHAQDFDAALRALSAFDRFTRAVVERRPADAHLLVCSDHGNVEDLSTRSHTLHPVALLHFGPAALPFEPRHVADVGRAVLALHGVARAP